MINEPQPDDEEVVDFFFEKVMRERGKEVHTAGAIHFYLLCKAAKHSFCLGWDI
jgi:hypothetical protein